MNCIKCGKELEENEKELCKECAKKEKKPKKEKKENPKTENEVKETKDVLEEIIEEEKNEVKEEKKEKKSKKESKKEEKVEEVVEEKEVVENEKEETTENEKKEKKGSKVVNVIVGIILAALIIVVGVLCVRKMLAPDVGATIGNIRNYGYSVADNNWIYYMSFDETGANVTLNKIRQNGKDEQVLATDNWTILSLNVENNWLYFIGLKQIDSSTFTEEQLNSENLDLNDNKIYKIRTNGKDLTVINDNEFDENSYEIYVVDERVYYKGEDGLLYSMDVNGGDRKAVIDSACEPVGITDKYIFYTKVKEDNSEVTACINLDGTNEKEINGSRLYSLNVDGDDIYYVKEDLYVYKTSIANGGEELISDQVSAYNMNVQGDWIYFLNYVEESEEELAVGIYKMKKDGSEVTLLEKLASYSSFLNVVGDWVYYTDSDERYGYVKILKTDGSEDKVLYSLDFLPETDETTTNEQVSTEETTETTNTAETTETNN